MDQATRNIAVTEVVAEFHRAAEKHPRFNSAHEGFAVILEEVDELKAGVWKGGSVKRDIAAMRKEAVQVAATALRFLTDVCLEVPADSGPKVVKRTDGRGDAHYLCTGHFDDRAFIQEVERMFWKDLLFGQIVIPERIWMIEDYARDEYRPVPEGTPGSLPFTHAWGISGV